MRFAAFILAALPTFVLAEEAEMSERQLAALAIVTPMILAQTPEEQGKMLSECVVLSARRGELRKLAKADPELETQPEATVAIVQTIIQRPAVIECFTEMAAPK